MRVSRRPADLARALLLVAAVAVPLANWRGVLEAYAVPKLLVLSVAVPVAGILVLLARDDRAAAPARRERLAGAAALAFLLWNALSFVVAGPDRQGLYGERYLLQGLWSIAIYVAAWWLGTRVFPDATGRRSLVRALALAGGTVGLVAAWQVASGDLPRAGIFASRATSTIGQPNALGAFLAMAAPAAVSLALLDGPRWERLLAVAAAALALFGVVASGSRGGLLAVAVVAAIAAVLVAAALRGEPRRGARSATRAALALAAALVVLLALPPVRDLLGRTVDRSSGSGSLLREESVRQHLDLWAVGLRIVRDHPVLGIGPERFPIVFPLYRERVLPPERALVYVDRRAESPHGVPVAVAVAGGLPALCLYVALVCFGLAGLFARSAGPPDAASATDVAALALGLALVAHLVADLFISAEFSSAWFGWLLLGAGAARRRSSAGSPSTAGGRLG